MNRRWYMVMAIPIWAGATGCQQAPAGQGEKPPPVVVYDLPIKRMVTDHEEFPGYTDAIYSVQVRARVSGYMTNVYFKDGLQVQKGNKLFEIDPRQYKADFDRAKGTVSQYEAHVRRLDREYQRAKNLLAKRSISQEEYDRYEADYNEAVANLEVAIANRDLAALNLEWTEVTAPIDGMLSRRMVDPGNLVKADDTILTSIVSLDPLYVYFDVHEQALLRIKRLIQEGKIKVQVQGAKAVPIEIGLSDETGFPHEGHVDFFDNRVDSATGTLRFRGTIKNPADRDGNRFIIPGLFVKVRLQIGEPHSSILVREQSLVRDQGRKQVWVLTPKKNDQGKPETNEKGQTLCVAKPVDIGVPGVLRESYLEIKQGVAAGDWVVTSGMQRIRVGIDVWAEKDPSPPAAPPTAETAAGPSPKPEPTSPPHQQKSAAAAAVPAPALADGTGVAATGGLERARKDTRISSAPPAGNSRRGPRGTH
jgi:RND family efflux transporter MFP subunit